MRILLACEFFYPSVGGAPEIKDYFALFDRNIDAFVNAMKGKQ